MKFNFFEFLIRALIRTFRGISRDILFLLLLAGAPLYADLIFKTEESSFLSLEIRNLNEKYRYQVDYSLDKSNDLALRYKSHPDDRFWVDYDELLQVRRIVKIDRSGYTHFEMVINREGGVERIREFLKDRGEVYLKFSPDGFLLEKKFKLNDNLYHYKYRHQNTLAEVVTMVDYFINNKFHSQKKTIYLGNKNDQHYLRIEYYDHYGKMYKYQKLLRRFQDNKLVSEIVDNFLSDGELQKRGFNFIENNLPSEKRVIDPNLSGLEDQTRYSETYVFTNGYLREKNVRDASGRLTEKKEYYYKLIDNNLGFVFIDLLKNNWLEKSSFHLDDEPLLNKFSLYNVDQKLVMTVKEEIRSGVVYKEASVIVGQAVDVFYYQDDQLYRSEVKNAQGEIILEEEFSYNKEGYLLERKTRQVGKEGWVQEKNFYQIPKVNSYRHTSPGEYRDKLNLVSYHQRNINFFLGKTLFRHYKNKLTKGGRTDLISKRFPERISLKNRFQKYRFDKFYPDSKKVFDLELVKLIHLLELKRMSGLVKVIRFDENETIDDYLRMYYPYTSITGNGLSHTIEFRYYQRAPVFHLLADYGPDQLKNNPFFDVDAISASNYQGDFRGSKVSFINNVNDQVPSQQEYLSEKIIVNYELPVNDLQTLFGEDGNLIIDGDVNPLTILSKYRILELRKEVYDPETGKVIRVEVLKDSL